MGVITMSEIIIAALTSGAVFSFIQFLISLAFSRKDKTNEIAEKLEALANQVDENQAILARTHILRFSDEIRNGVHHSNEYFRQQLDDCDTYERYCEKHPDFKNSYTMIANKHIKETYERLTKEGKL